MNGQARDALFAELEAAREEVKTTRSAFLTAYRRLMRATSMAIALGMPTRRIAAASGLTHAQIETELEARTMISEYLDDAHG